MSTLSADQLNGAFQQKRLSERAFLMLVAFFSAFIPLSTDLYLPALPSMATSLDTTTAQVNLTLVIFMVFFSAGMVFWGPLSDKFGRKPILTAGLIIFTIASVLCACSTNITQLIIFRAFQAIGGGAVTTVAMAMVKDNFEGHKRESVLGIVQSMVIIAPIIAPIIGAYLMKFTSWQGIFWVLAGCGALAFILTFLLEESLQDKTTGSIFKVYGRLVVVLKNPGFSALLALFSLPSLSQFAFIAASSYIYINQFGLSEQGYSYFFALNGVFAMLGPLLYILLSKRFSRTGLVSGSFLLMLLSGLLVFYFGNDGYWAFALGILPITFASNAIRPPSTNLMLEQQDHDTGSASSLINCFGFLLGSMGMVLVSLEWSDLVKTVGIINIIIGIICVVAWKVLHNHPIVKQVSE